MINEERVRLMTDVALLSKKGDSEHKRICCYRKGNYIAFYVVMNLLFGTVVYLLATAVFLIYWVGADPGRTITFDTVNTVVVFWACIYFLYSFVSGLISGYRANIRYRKALTWKKQYIRAVSALEKYDRRQRSTEKKTEERWMVHDIREGKETGL